MTENVSSKERVLAALAEVDGYQDFVILQVEDVKTLLAHEPWEATGCDCPGLHKPNLSAHAPNCPYRVIKEIHGAAQPPAGTLKAAWDAINARIPHGLLSGDGTDKTAERNGMIIATNIIAEMMWPSETKSSVNESASNGRDASQGTVADGPARLATETSGTPAVRHIAHSIRCAKYPFGEPGASWRDVPCTCGANQEPRENQPCPKQKDGHHDFRHEVCDCGASRGDSLSLSEGAGNE